MHLLVSQELSLDVEVLAANRTVKGSRTAIFLVRFFMLIEIVLARKVLPAYRAGKHFLSRVRNDVPHQVLLPTERFAAAGFVALEWPQSDVRFEMLHQVFLAFE